MAYMDQLQAVVKSLAQAGESGRRDLDSMTAPVNSAISDLSGAASELEGLPIVGDLVGGQLQRVMGRVAAAQAKVGQVVSTYNTATRMLSGIDERLVSLKEQAGRAMSAASGLISRATDGGSDKALAAVVPSSSVTEEQTPAAPAVTPFPHLLIIQPHDPKLEPYYFNLDTAAFSELRRRTGYRWASQERLSRRPAQQAVGQGEENLTLKGDIFPGWRGGIKQLDTLRSIGSRLQALHLVTGYGASLGNWCLVSIEEDQAALLQGGVPRKQSFSLEFQRYGDDLTNL